MSDETNKAPTEAVESKNHLEQAASLKVEIQAETEADTAEEKIEEERPGSCCGSCS